MSPLVLMAYRSAAQDSTSCSPALLMLGREIRTSGRDDDGQTPRHPRWILRGLNMPGKLQDRLESAHQFARGQLQSAGARQERSYDVHNQRTTFRSRRVGLGVQPTEEERQVPKAGQQMDGALHGPGEGGWSRVQGSNCRWEIGKLPSTETGWPPIEAQRPHCEERLEHEASGTLFEFRHRISLRFRSMPQIPSWLDPTLLHDRRVNGGPLTAWESLLFPRGRGTLMGGGSVTDWGLGLCMIVGRCQ